MFDIGSFASASESGFSLKLMQFASKSLDGLIYHMSAQKSYYERFFPWIVGKSRFIRYGADFDFFGDDRMINSIGRSYIVCAGKNKCDWNTVVKAYKESNVKITEGVTILTHGFDWSVLKGVYGDILGSSGGSKSETTFSSVCRQQF